MRSLALIFSFLLLSLSGQAYGAEEQNAEAEAATLFKAATTSLTEGRPADAIANLEALGDRKVRDPVVSFNRGLAYAGRIRVGAEEPGDLGRAAHGFEEARELSHDQTLVAEATRALKSVRAEVAKRRSAANDPVEIDSGISLGRSIKRLVHENTWAILAALCSLALSLGIVLRARATMRRVKIAATTTAAIALSMLAAIAAIMHSARNDRLYGRDAIIVAPGVRLLDAGHVAIGSMAALPEGGRVELLEETGEFAHVIVGRAEGWLPSSAVLPIAKNDSETRP